MVDVVALTCRACGSRLQVGGDVEQFACNYCGTEFVVRREGGVVSLAPLVAGLKRIEVGVDRTASELAIQRLRARIIELRLGIEEQMHWFCEKYGYPPKPPQVSYRGVIATMEGELCRSSAFFGRRRMEELRESIAAVRDLLEALESSQAKLKHLEQIVNEE